MDRGGLSGDDGPTHHGLFDISYLRGIPNLVHMVPKDEDELADMLFTAMQWNGPIAVRYPRGLGPGTPVKDVPSAIPIGKAEVLRSTANKDRVAIFALGSLVPMAEEIARKLEGRDIAAAVINARFAKPIDVAMLEFFAGTVEVILTLEDHVLRGGFGSAVLEELNILGVNTPVVRIGWPDQFIEHGKPEALRTKYGLTVEAALEKLKPYLKPAIYGSAHARWMNRPQGLRAAPGSLLRHDVSQRPLNAIHFFPNHPDRLLIARVRHRRNGGGGTPNFMIAVAYQFDSRRGLHPVMVNSSR